MVIEELEKPTPTQLELFAQNLPHKPYCTDDKGWLQIRKKSTAIKKKYIQHNQPQMVHWLVYDCDYAGALEYVGQQQLPAPNLVATNPENGNSHLFYRLADAVCKSDLARRKPLALLAKIDFVMTEKLEADRGYQGFISKNLLHPHWIVQEVHQAPWNLGDFLEWIDIPTRLPKRAQTQGLGRNCTMFEKARFWAYSKVLSYRLTSTRSKFYEAVLGYCETINQGFPSHLNHSEVRSTAKSVALWTWRNYTGASRSDEDWAKYVAETHTPEIQRERQELQVASRHRATKTARSEAKTMKAGGSTQAEIAKALGVSQQTVSRWLKAD
jgi:DNA-directed RNA polymerase specialized sigma24 family protein